jgi:hypothetical protein
LYWGLFQNPLITDRKGEGNLIRARSISFQQQQDKRKNRHLQRSINLPFAVFPGTAKPFQPPKGSFYYPPSGQSIIGSEIGTGENDGSGSYGHGKDEGKSP